MSVLLQSSLFLFICDGLRKFLPSCALARHLLESGLGCRGWPSYISYLQGLYLGEDER